MAGIGNLGGSESETRKDTRINDNRIAATEQAVVLSRGAVGGNVRSGNTTIRVGRGGAYNVTNTTTANLDTSKFEEGLQSINSLLAQQLAQKPNPVTGLPEPDPASPVTDRVNDQVTDAPAAEKKKQFSMNLIVGAILVIALMAVAIGKRKKG